MQTILKFAWNHKRPRTAKAIWRKNRSGGILLLNFKLYYKVIVIKTVQYWHKNRHIDQWNRTERTKINPCIYNQLIFDKAAKNTQWRKDILFNKQCWENWMFTCNRMKLDSSLTLLTKINTKWIKYLHVRPETIKLRRKHRKKLLDIDLGNDFMDMTSKSNKIKINMWDYIKLKRFCNSKENH